MLRWPGYLAALQVGVTAWFAIMSRFGVKDDPTKVMKVIDQMLTLDTCRAAVKSGDYRAMVGKCITPDELKLAFGLVWGTIASTVAAVSTVADYFRSALNAVFDSFNGHTRFTITVRHANASAINSFLGQWAVHDGTLCVGASLNLAAGSNQNEGLPPCSGSASVGYMSEWMGCGRQANGMPLCNEWFQLSLTSNPDGSVTATVVDEPIYTSTHNQAIHGFQDPYVFLHAGDTFNLAHTANGLLTATYLHTYKRDLNGTTSYWCNYQTISATNRPKCGA